MSVMVSPITVNSFVQHIAQSHTKMTKGHMKQRINNLLFSEVHNIFEHTIKHLV